jgi:hypothetical protein
VYRKYGKRLLDLVLAIIALPFWFIILLIIGPMIYIQDRGPIFYNAPRMGKDGKVFKMYKFRSMCLNAPDLRNTDGSTYSGENDPRVTKVGKIMRKTSIDELPQIYPLLNTQGNEYRTLRYFPIYCRSLLSVRQLDFESLFCVFLGENNNAFSICSLLNILILRELFYLSQGKCFSKTII